MTKKTLRKSGDQRRLHLDRRVDQIVAASDGDGDELLTSGQLAEWLAVSLQWVEISRAKGYGPPFIRVGARLVRYRRSAVLNWLDGRARVAA